MQIENPMVLRPIVEDGHWGVDALGDEIFYGDIIFEFPDGEIVLAENLPEYLIKFLGVQEKTAE
ncbi:YqaI family protein [Parageobacillus thermoglucosidasius]|jgi:hypothetical protein|uniref:YqaI family protein n=1 Tax=Parageobacillus thermoglucosidasius TaxID=1426 RepID=UPI000E12A87E|nr:hypothetical protein [Parageobacillus thermoglucosidasius]REK59000.1 MAG: hypothetical protein C6P36_02885 [Geobacillus sp.]MED4904092.1 hypothetical protein [Parageobacillus thermoglucosidasius]MED4915642.1 hypothetical protein [Parageobacillus thermoglucosidasius]MED4945093.1 hypothetical protein [Parageobacillus thermoglucosidasius]MED4983710.1 hypothetical protein [Parageobacillus thermoglucosidasius]